MGPFKELSDDLDFYMVGQHCKMVQWLHNGYDVQSALKAYDHFEKGLAILSFAFLFLTLSVTLFLFFKVCVYSLWVSFKLES